MRSMEEVRLAANLIRRASEILNGIDERALPGEDPRLRTVVRAASYDIAGIAEDLSQVLDVG